MIIDFNNSDIEVHYSCDLCLIGSGAAVLSMLTRFYNTNLNVIVVEAGEEKITDRNQGIYDVITPYHPFNGARDGRFRVFGGSTIKWGGQSLPLDKIDFTKRDWVPFSGWPIPYEEVAKYYIDVEHFLNLYPIDYKADIYKLLKESPLPKSDDLDLRFSKWTHKPNLRENYREAIKRSKNITLILNANMSTFELAESCNTVSQIIFKNFDKKTAYLRARKYVLACGGIENARILLASNNQKKKGIGNDFDVVGRYLQDHPNAQIGSLSDTTGKAQSYFNYFYIRQTRFLPRFILSEHVQKSRQILNASASLLFITENDNPFSLAKEIYRKQIRGELSIHDLKIAFKLLSHVPQVYTIWKKYIINKKVYTPNSSVRLNLMMENTPQWENRVFLSTIKDELDMPKAIVSWKIDNLAKHTIKECTKIFKKYLDQTGLGLFKTEDWINTDYCTDYLIDAKHHIGTTRMSDSRISGVVDLNCKVFDTDNLYIAGSSVFPTSGHSNPTSTLIALAFRLAEHLKSELK